MVEPSPVRAGKGEAVIASLKARIARIENTAHRFAPAGERENTSSGIWTLGLDAIDSRLPGAALSAAGVHEIAAETYPDGPAALGFSAALAIRRLAAAGGKPVLWIRPHGASRETGWLYGHGLGQLGLPRRALLTLALRRADERDWALEEALKSGALGLVIADMTGGPADLTRSRRFGLAAAAGTTPALLLHDAPLSGGTAGLTRWRVAARPSTPPAYDPSAPGAPAWSLSLERCRSGRPGGPWSVEWHHETHSFTLVSAVSDRAHAGEPPQGRPTAAGSAGPALRPDRQRQKRA